MDPRTLRLYFSRQGLVGQVLSKHLIESCRLSLWAESGLGVGHLTQEHRRRNFAVEVDERCLVIA